MTGQARAPGLLGALDYFPLLLETLYSLDVTFTPALQALRAVLGLLLPGVFYADTLRHFETFDDDDLVCEGHRSDLGW